MTSQEQVFQDFAAFTAKLKGDEKSEATTFLFHLLEAYNHNPNTLPEGATFEYRVKMPDGHTKFADFVWPGRTLIEMKSRGEPLQKHYRQAVDYWTWTVPNRPRYVVLCNFDEFRVYDFETQPDSPKDIVATAELPDRFNCLAFLFPEYKKPTFGNDHEAVTREAADKLAQCFKKFVNRGVERPLAQRFILQMLVALFAEDIGLLEREFVLRILDECAKPADTFDLIGGLFEAMNNPKPASGGRFKGVAYFNGGLFADPARIELTDSELVLLREAAKFNWAKVQPEIFGNLFQHSLEAGERRAFGAHFTHPADIQKIVRPTIVEPWRAEIEGAKTLTRLNELRQRLHHFRVLDPACGSGNFLYIAYRELKRLEARLIERVQEFPSQTETGQMHLSFLSAQNFYGLDINPFAVEIAKVTMMIARKLAIDELHVTEPALPLDNLDKNFIAADALLANGHPATWPVADVIIGNPPFVGAKLLKPERGADYVNAVRKAYPDVPGMADYCVYWFRKANDHLPPCTAADPFAGRAGLVGTQNVRNNQSRVGGLDYIVKTGTIIEAVDNQPWSGEANVHVSIVNWVKTQDATLLPKTRRLWFKVVPAAGVKKIRKAGSGSAAKEYELDCRECAFINSALSIKTDVSATRRLKCNTDPQRVFQGVTPGYAGFVLKPEEQKRLVHACVQSAAFIKPYLIGRELVSGDGTPRRFLIDAFGCTILDLDRSPHIRRHLQEKILPAVKAKIEEVKTKNADMVKPREEHLKRWWTFWAQRLELRAWMSQHSRVIAASRTQRIPFAYSFISTAILPGDKLQLFAFDDDYAFGILQAAPHCVWYERRASRLKNEEDYNYSTDAVFDTFPWPQTPTAKQIETVAEAGRKVRRVRAETMERTHGGLRALYHTLELPGKNPLKDAHADLDAAVLDAYGFSGKKDLLAQLLALNLEVAKRIEDGQPVTAPGVPKGYPDTEKLVTEDCIRPPNVAQ